MPTVLITQCLQRDFVDPISPHDPLPNLLHVGHAESTRLLGPFPASGPLAQLLDWARSLPEDEIDIVHVRDWHDPTDPSQREHLERFGDHCIKDSRGARLVLGMDDAATWGSNEHLVDSLTLNDLEGTDLRTHLEMIGGSNGASSLRVGVIGVWTEAKVSFLLYDLKTRLGIDELATCSALTASASRSQHFNALSQLEKILGVRCFESLADFVAWLHPGGTLMLPPHPIGFEPRIEVGASQPEIGETDRAIVAHLFRDSTDVALEPLTGGYSGCLVWRATSEDALGHRQAPSVVKVGPNRVVAQERVSFERIEAVLGNSAPRLQGYVDLGERAGIKYSYASMGQGSVRTLQEMFRANLSTRRLIALVREVFERVLGPLYAAAQYERMPLLEHYQFSPSLAEAVRRDVDSLGFGDQPVIEFPGGLALPNVRAFYEDFLGRHRAPAHDYHYVGYVHGDLNPANVLVDAHQNVWVIDYSHAGPAHVLKDLAKFENDLLYLMTPVESAQELEEAIAITKALRSVADLRAALPEAVHGVRSPQLVRAWEMVRVVRRIVGELCHEDRHPIQLQVALLRYAVHTLGFPEASPWQRQWALASACSHAEQIVETANAESKLRVDWMVTDVLGEGRLGLTLCPGRRDRGRELGEDLGQLVADRVDRLLCLLTDSELEWAGVASLGSTAAAAGMEYRRVPIADQGVPEMEEAADLVRWCRAGLALGERVVVTCMGGLGRSGTIAACVLVDAGASPEAAIALVRAARGPRALETAAQEAFVYAFGSRTTRRR